jgi:hypothetical protein
MFKLNLETKTKEQELIKQYLEENVSETLANKINNGVKIVKNNKTLINKKDLNGFMNYANQEARKLAEKGSSCACIEDKVVYGWAVHYFEEDSIDGKLFNEDGTEYKVEIKKTAPKIESKLEPKKPEKQQATLFDLMSFDTSQKQEKIEENEPTTEELNEPPIEYEIEETDNDIEDFSEQEIDEELDKVANEIVRDSNVQIDKQTGEVLSQIEVETPTIDKDYMKMLYVLLDGKLTLNKE